MNLFRHVTLSAIGFALSAAPAPCQTAPPVVVELFTSQGCSSCPPADKLLAELAKDPSVVALSMSVDYWDYLGWKDTLALQGHTHRQRGYASARGDREVYTPQLVINGKVHVVGNDRDEIEKAMSIERAQPTLSLPVSVDVEPETIRIAIKPGPAVASSVGDVWLCLVKRDALVKIAKGENRGREITYHNVVRRWVKVGTWSGEEKSWTVPRGDFARDNPDAVAVLVQSGNPENPGLMLGAAMASLR